MSRPTRLTSSLIAFGFACGLAALREGFGQTTGDSYYDRYNYPPGTSPYGGNVPLPERTPGWNLTPVPSPSPQHYTYFPPEPPIFGGKIVEAGGPVFRFMDQLADYVGEPFYPPLSTRLRQGELAKSVADHLASYRAQRDRLRNDLLNQLAATSALEPAARAAALRDFARIQTAAIEALETDAQALRDELIQRTWLHDSADWNEGRRWSLSGDHARIPPAAFDNAEFQVTRAAAFFQPGLGAAQRGLIYELAIAEREKLPEQHLFSDRRSSTASDPTIIFFSPETARFRLPATLPAELRAKFGQFVHDKDALKRELRETLIAQDGASEAKRRAAFQKLTEQQWPRVTALDELAESIRVDLAALPPPPRPAPPPQFPADLLARIDANRAALIALGRERLALPPLQLAATPASLSPKNSASRAALAEVRADARAELLPAATDPDGRPIADRYAALAVRHTALLVEFRAAYQRIAAANAAFAQLGREEVIFRDYRTAMLEPGLSPEQRRLLFTYALAGLAQALPDAEPLPSARFSPAW